MQARSNAPSQQQIAAIIVRHFAAPGARSTITPRPVNGPTTYAGNDDSSTRRAACPVASSEDVMTSRLTRRTFYSSLALATAGLATSLRAQAPGDLPKGLIT